MKLNDFQRAVLRDYADGEHALLANEDELSSESIRALDDPLLTFLLDDLSHEAGCTDCELAIERMEGVQDEILTAYIALLRLSKEINARQHQMVEDTAGEEVSS